jgi:predicted ATPase
MASIKIRNIGPITKADFDLNKINVFMGPQSSGKSTIAKICSQCSWYEKNAEALREYQKKWRTINVNKTKEYHKNWRASHREDWNKICRESRQRSKAKKLEAELKTKENTNQ